MCRVQFSLDDTKGCFRYLAEHPETKSIFHTRVLAYLKQLHEEYGTEFTLFCMYKNNGFSLPEVGGQFRDEFMENAGWLHFGFHAFDEESNYAYAKPGQVEWEYRLTMKQVGRITGSFEYADILRLHKFAGNRDACRELRKQGIRGLLTSDDERSSYYLSAEKGRLLKEEGRYMDETEGLGFYPSLTRLEKSQSPVEEMKKALEKQYELLAVFTHEWQMDGADIRKKLRECCGWASRSL